MTKFYGGFLWRKSMLCVILPIFRPFKTSIEPDFYQKIKGNILYSGDVAIFFPLKLTIFVLCPKRET